MRIAADLASSIRHPRKVTYDIIVWTPDAPDELDVPHPCALEMARAVRRPRRYSRTVTAMAQALMGGGRIRILPGQESEKYSRPEKAMVATEDSFGIKPEVSEIHWSFDSRLSLRELAMALELITLDRADGGYQRLHSRLTNGPPRIVSGEQMRQLMDKEPPSSISE